MTILSPKHGPYHLFEFALRSFETRARRSGCQVRALQYDVCKTFLSRELDPAPRLLMRAFDSGTQLCVWLGRDPLM